MEYYKCSYNGDYDYVVLGPQSENEAIFFYTDTKVTLYHRVIIYIASLQS